MKRYLIFIDVDDTLVQTGQFFMDQRIPELFKRIQADGHVVAIVSGRALKGILKINGIEKAKYVCGLMGRIAINTQTNQKIMDPRSMNKNEVKSFVKEVNKLGLKWTYKDDFTEKTYFTDSEIIKKYSPEVVGEKEVYKDIENSKVFQLLVDGTLPDSIVNSYKNFEFLKMPGDYYDIITKGHSKSIIVEFLKKLYPGYISVAIGDSVNDIPMFEKCEIKIAMGNAKNQLKQISTYITKNLEENGVVYAIENILKI